MVLPLVLVLLMGNASATDGIRCNPDGAQIEMNACASDDFEAADKALNSTYSDVLACGAGNRTFIENLKIAQRSWIRFRDTELDSRFPVAAGENDRVVYGSMYPMLYFGEKTRLTKERTAQLRAYIEDEERNLHCDPSLLKNPGKYHVEDR